VVTAGGYTNAGKYFASVAGKVTECGAAPLLEIAKILAFRGYQIDFATLSGREQWVENCAFVSGFHVIGPSVPADVEEANYRRMSNWTTDLISNWGAIIDSKIFMESSWPDAYRGLSKLAQSPATRPDFILADYWVDAARDVSFEHDIPLAMHWPQMPTIMLPAPYIPGTPGLQIEVLTSEFATIWQRLRSAMAIYTSLPQYLRYLRWRKNMRLAAGVTRSLPLPSKPDYLCLVNSFFGLEAAKDLPPNVSAVGPILNGSLLTGSLNAELEKVLATRHRVLYVSLGTHVLLAAPVMNELLVGVLAALRSRTIDGVIWSMPSMARKQLDMTVQVWPPSYTGDGSMTVANLLNNEHPSMFFVHHAPQPALLHDTRVVAFLSHAGPSSVNEALHAGVPLVTVAVYFDQLQNAMRLRDAGVSVPLDKDTLDSDQVHRAIKRIVEDIARDGPMAANVGRMRRIARIAAGRKYYAADLIEEVLVDWKGRRKEGGYTDDNCRPRGMHLQTADGRMPSWKAKNWDLKVIGAAATFCLVGILVVLPVALRAKCVRNCY
jgi:UDP:flavonoid glycosyltransferase YjiC (YdhE family)